ncbi:hypothetical protein Pla8534_64320 [Lignipirellula cremea]|uniref:Uncharacterized protein n=1 Tax=Lignipirellula cremea TaxID=2528010 RepID=A0A518E3B5_9BACT|nr:hypothetical protein Pla8534_64320 [Lignipirellula cremea]
MRTGSQKEPGVTPTTQFFWIGLTITSTAGSMFLFFCLLDASELVLPSSAEARG